MATPERRIVITNDGILLKGDRRGWSILGTRDQIQINGMPIRIHGNFERVVTDETGAQVAEIEVVVIVRGRMPNKQFIQLISRDHVRLDFEEASGGTSTWFTRIGNHSAVASGAGEGTIYRHDILFRETPESYKRRMDEQAALKAEQPEPVRRQTSPVEPEPMENISQVLAAADPSGWGEAIKQLKNNGAPKPVYEEPMTMAELTAIETVLTNLRIDALIDQLAAAGLVRREAVDERFRALLDQRFMAEAIPLVGEKVARRATREMAAS